MPGFGPVPQTFMSEEARVRMLNRIEANANSVAAAIKDERTKAVKRGVPFSTREEEV